ncbi:MAG: hypothetical protein JNM69_27795 [Archangium sp.]|nr:hypothetical protein [Archangium sp.]
MRTWLLLVGVVLALTGCGKKSSKEFFAAQGRYESLVAREGDDAYVSDEMKQISAALAGVPTNAVEYDRARALIAKIDTERTRVEAEQAAEAAALAAAQAPTVDSRPSELLAPPPAQPANPSPTEAVNADGPPEGGLPEAAFVQKYGRCATGPIKQTIDGVGEVPTYKANGTPDCLKKLGLTEVSSFFFVKGALAGRVSASVTTNRTTFDAGQTVIPQPAQEYMAIPGAPLPAGMTAPPRPSTGSLDVAPTGQGLAPTRPEGGLAPRANP